MKRHGPWLEENGRSPLASRRRVVKALVAGGAAVAMGRTAPALAQAAPGKAVKIAALADLDQELESVEFEYEGTPAILVRVPAPKEDDKAMLERTLEAERRAGDAVQKVYLAAHSRVCTHQGCLVERPQNNVLGCDCHGSRFDLASGSLIQGPARRPLQAVKLEVRNGEVYAVGLA